LIGSVCSNMVASVDFWIETQRSKVKDEFYGDIDMLDTNHLGRKLWWSHVCEIPDRNICWFSV